MGRHDQTTEKTATNYVTPFRLPDPYEREVLDVMQEEATEVVEAVMRRQANGTNGAGSSQELTAEVGDLFHAAQVAWNAGLTGTAPAPPTEFPRDGEGEDGRPTTEEIADEHGSETMTALGAACILLAKRCSKARRFGCEEKEPGQDRTNAERIADAWQDVQRISLRLVRAGGIDPEGAEAGRRRKQRQLGRFMQHEPGGTRRRQAD